MKEVRAKLSNIKRAAVSGIGGGVKQYDDNVLRLSLKIFAGPEAWVDRHVFADVSIDTLVQFVSEEVGKNLRDALIEKFTEKPKTTPVYLSDGSIDPNIQGATTPILLPNKAVCNDKTQKSP